MAPVPSRCMKRCLLYAAEQAYHPRIETAGRRIGWLEPPILVRRALAHRAIDQALVGRVPEGVVVAFRGSLSPFFGEEDGWDVLLDWFNSGLAACVRRAEYPGGVHLGFAESVERLWDDAPDGPGVRAAAERMLDRSLLDRRAGHHLFIAGHSKGGALANLFAWRMAGAADWRGVPVSVATFAAARAGNHDFAGAYDASRIACLRYEVPSDLVPHLPPGPGSPGWVRALARELGSPVAGADYEPVGLRIGPRRGHAPWQGSRRLLPRLLGRRGAGLERALPGMLAAHTIAPESDYDRLVCTGEEGCRHGQ